MKTYLRIYSICIIYLASGALLHAQPGRWSEPVNVSNTPGGCISPAMAIGPDGYIHIVWGDDSRLEDPWMDDILYVYYDGYHWSEPEQISSFDTTYSMHPRIAIDSFGYPHVIWKHRAIFPDAAIYYTCLTDTGWAEPLDLTEGIGAPSKPSITIDSNDNIHVVMSTYNGGGTDIFYRMYDGFEWLPIDTIIITSDDSSDPVIALDSQNHLHLAWQEGAYPSVDVFYSKSDGLSWSPIQNISQIDSLPSLNISLALDTFDHPHIVWNQITQWGPLPVIEEIFYSYYNGENWSLAENITNLDLRIADNPAIAISSQGVICVIFSSSSQNGDPYPNYLFCVDSQWTYPDTMLTEDYRCGTLDLAIDNNDFFHASLSTGFDDVSNIGYTYYEYNNSIRPGSEISAMGCPEIFIYPNPFNDLTRISFSLTAISEINLQIYNLNGQVIKNVENRILPAGSYTRCWDGSNQFGKGVSAGVYLLRLQVNGKIFTQKMTLVK